MVKFVEIAPKEYENYAAELLWFMRKHDHDEVVASHGAGRVFNTVLESLRASERPLAAYGDDGFWCAFGIVPQGSLLTPLGAPWQLGTDTASRHPAGLIRATRRYLDQMQERYPVLMNFVDARNTPSLRYLKAVGFTIEKPEPYGVSGLPFHRFHRGID